MFQLGKCQLVMNGQVLFVTIPLGNHLLHLKKGEDCDLWHLKALNGQLIDIYCIKKFPNNYVIKSVYYTEYFHDVRERLIEHYDEFLFLE